MLDVRLGPFALRELVGRGGMGRVFRGEHVDQGVPVAIKVLTSAKARNPMFHVAFANEVRAMAGLDHPGVAMVMDYGEVDRHAAVASGGELVAGSPYLAMELASEGALSDCRDGLVWPQVRELLLSLLDALAHAHARGVVHRDIKPGNILRCGPGDYRPGWKLTDFGIAHALEKQDRRRETERPAGTPFYMAPEQFRGTWRDNGPWTDLYAVGCLGWELVCGRRPFDALTFDALKQAHLADDPPALVPRMPVPPGLQALLWRLMQKEPAQRFERAADAAWALRQLPEPIGDAMPVTPVLEDRSTLDLVDTRQTTQEIERTPDLVETVLADVVTLMTDTQEPTETTDDATPFAGPVGLAPLLAPPVPPTWREQTHVPPPMQLVGAGLGLYGLRAIPMVGREDVRDRLWNALRAAARDRSARAVVLRGVAGVGKSRLAEWLGRRAHATGTAHVLRATHSPLGGPNDGLSRMLALQLQAVGLDRDTATARVRQLLTARGSRDPRLPPAVVELMHPGGDQVRFGSPGERYEVITALLGVLTGVRSGATRRCAVLWLDDVQWGSDALGLASWLIRHRNVTRLPVLVVLTAREEALAERPVEATQLEELAEAVEVIDVPPLDGSERVALVRQLLHLEGSLAADVEARTGGNPLFAIHLVGDWVQRRVLRPGPTGFVLADGARADLPGSLEQMWRGRVEALLRPWTDEEARALELAAALGQDVADAEWAAVCDLAGVEPPRQLVHALVTARLARLGDDGFAFAHGMIREVLELRALEGGRWPAHHAICGRMLERRHGERGVAERLGVHLLAAGERERALVPLLRGASERGDLSEFRLAHAVLDRRERALRELGVPDDDPRWAEGWLVREFVLRQQGKLALAEREAERALAVSRDQGWRAVQAPALLALGAIERQTGRFDACREHLEEAAAAFEALGDALGLGNALYELASLARWGGMLDRSDELHRAALDRFHAVGDLRGIAMATDGLGLNARADGRIDDAVALHREAMKQFELLGDLVGRAEVWRGLGEAERARGDLDRAEACFRRGLELLRTAESEWDGPYRSYLGLVLLERGEFVAARKILDDVYRLMEAWKQPHYLGAIRMAQLVCAAGAGDWRGFRALFASGVEFLDGTSYVTAEIAAMVESAANLAERSERPEAAEARAYAASMWRRMGREDRAAR